MVPDAPAASTLAPPVGQPQAPLGSPNRPETPASSFGLVQAATYHQ